MATVLFVCLLVRSLMCVGQTATSAPPLRNFVCLAQMLSSFPAHTLTTHYTPLSPQKHPGPPTFGLSQRLSSLFWTSAASGFYPGCYPPNLRPRLHFSTSPHLRCPFTSASSFCSSASSSPVKYINFRINAFCSREPSSHFPFSISQGRFPAFHPLSLDGAQQQTT